MDVSYERSGGFIGVRQRLDLSGGTLKAADQRSGYQQERRLTPGEVAQLAAAVAKVEGAAPPDGQGGGASDGFVLRITLPSASATLHTLAFPFGAGDGTPWGDLAALLDGLIEGALAGKVRRPDLVDPALLE